MKLSVAPTRATSTSFLSCAARGFFLALFCGSTTFWVVACFTATPERPPTRPPTAGELEMGYQEAIDLGNQQLAQQGYTDAQFHHAVQLRPNLWRVRFGLAPKGSGRVIDLYFDGTERKLIRSEELTDSQGRPITDAGALPR